MSLCARTRVCVWHLACCTLYVAFRTSYLTLPARRTLSTLHAAPLCFTAAGKDFLVPSQTRWCLRDGAHMPQWPPASGLVVLLKSRRGPEARPRRPTPTVPRSPLRSPFFHARAAASGRAAQCVHYDSIAEVACCMSCACVSNRCVRLHACVRACVYLRMHGVRVRMRVQMYACVCVCARYNAQAAECDNIVATHFRVGADFAESVIILENFLRQMISTLKCTLLRASTLHAPTAPLQSTPHGLDGARLCVHIGSGCIGSSIPPE